MVAEAIKIKDKGFVINLPKSGSFSKIIKKVIKTINNKFIVPPTNAKDIKAQQQPRQKTPNFVPIENDPEIPSFQLCKKKVKGDLHFVRQASFRGLNWYKPAISKKTALNFVLENAPESLRR